ncbi:MAG TPA: Ig-like domain-containing protein, partial [Methylococcaceae bacterium]|nr:Ig-like domain-containing protein [Methylococcaceae bacterium]
LNADGSFTYTPDADYNGADSFTYRVNDGELDSNLATVRFTVTPVNDAPVATDASYVLAEDGGLGIDLLALAGDIDSATFTAAIMQPPLHGRLERNADGTYTYTPDANYNGEDSIVYQVNDGQLDSNLATVRFTVTPVNDAPTAGDQNLATDEDTALIGNLLATAADIDSAVLTASIVAAPSHGRLAVDADGSFVYTPDADYNGTDHFSYRVKDGDPSTSSGQGLDSAVATVAVTIRPVNDAPVLHDLALSTAEDTPLSLDLLAQGFDVDGDALTVVILEAPLYGQLVQTADGAWVYTPNPDFNGSDRFTYRVSDGQLDSNPATVQLTVTPVNDAPVAYDSSATGIEDTPYVFRPADFDAFDVDGDALTLAIASLPLDGQLQSWDGTAWTAVALNQTFTAADIAAARLRFVPDEDESGGPGYGQVGYGNQKAHYAQFSYIARDGQLESAEATVTLDILPAADAPLLSFTTVGIGASRDLFRTTWEGEGNEESYNQSPVSTLVLTQVLQGWNLVLPPDNKGGQKAFEIWSEGDQMHDPHGRPQTVHAAQGSGNWLELNDARGQGHQTLGIERSITTKLGATYTLNLDYAGRIGFSAAYTQIGVYVDGIRIGGYAGTSPETALDWKNLSFHFAGTGKAQTIRLVSEATTFDANGRGAMLDNLVLSESLPIDTGYEDGPIRLASITAALTDTDGSEGLNVTIDALPIGSTLTDGTHTFTATQDNTTAEITGWDLAHLSFTPPENYYGILHLRVTATATETATGATTTTHATLAVVVLPVNDAPIARNAAYALPSNGSTTLDFADLVSDVDSPVLNLGYTQPAHGTLTRNSDGTYTYVPEAGYSGWDGFTYTVSDGETTITRTVVLAVGVPLDPETQSTLVISSSLPGGSATLSLPDSAPPPPIQIDWNAVPDLPFAEQQAWIADLLGLSPEQLCLAEQTGLVVRVNQ